jgi:hypothetical protein
MPNTTPLTRHSRSRIATSQRDQETQKEPYAVYGVGLDLL